MGIATEAHPGAAAGGSSYGTASGRPPKFCVYAIAKNEIKHVESFMKACQVRGRAPGQGL